MNITDSEEKIAIVEALVAKGEVSFRDALKLLNEPYQVSIPSVWPAQPWEVTYNPADYQPITISST
jgi:hypothetical protein